MKCPNCGAEIPESKKFCGDCGTGLPQPPPPESVELSQPTNAQVSHGWMHSNWKGLASLIIVMVVALSIVGLTYTQPWSKVKVIVYSEYGLDIGINVYIDGQLKTVMDIKKGTTIVGVWSVVTGNRVVALDHGTWDSWEDYYGIVHYFSNSYEDPDGIMDYAYEYGVGPLYTKNVYIRIALPP